MTPHPIVSASSAITHLLDVVPALTGMRTSFLGQVSVHRYVIIHVCDQGGCRLEEGRSVPLSETYCQMVARARTTIVIPNTLVDERVRDLAATTEVNIGSYIGVPVFLSDGALYGTLCGVDPLPTSLTLAQSAQMEKMAALTGYLISTARSTFCQITPDPTVQT